MPFDIDISDSFTWEEGLPRPQWDLLSTWVESRVEPAEHAAAWTHIARQWLEKLGPALGPNYHLDETDRAFLLSALSEEETLSCLRFMHHCLSQIPLWLPGTAIFPKTKKQVVLALANRDVYYQYICSVYPEGHFGDSGGVRIRAGHPHIAATSAIRWSLHSILAHELTHAALDHLELPQWIEEGITQLFERRLAQSEARLALNSIRAAEHRRFWARHG